MDRKNKVTGMVLVKFISLMGNWSGCIDTICNRRLLREGDKACIDQDEFGKVLKDNIKSFENTTYDELAEVAKILMRRCLEILEKEFPNKKKGG